MLIFIHIFVVHIYPGHIRFFAKEYQKRTKKSIEDGFYACLICSCFYFRFTYSQTTLTLIMPSRAAIFCATTSGSSHSTSIMVYA